MDKTILSFQATTSMAHRLRVLAAQRNLSRSALIRQAIETQLHIPDDAGLPGDGAGQPVVFDADRQGGADGRNS